MSRPIMYHIPVCPFSQRLEILLDLKGQTKAVTFHQIDITVPRPDWLLEKTDGTTALPALEIENGKVLKESLVILRYMDAALNGPKVARQDPYQHAIENMLIAMEGPLGNAGYGYILNQDPAARDAARQKLDAQYGALDKFLRKHAPDGPFLFSEFGLAEAVFTPFFMRFWFNDYYEDYALPPELTRVAQWRDACLTHPSTQQVSFDQIVKLYYDYAVGAGNGAMPEGRQVSSFAFAPDWSQRPMPPKNKWTHKASDAELGLI